MNDERSKPTPRGVWYRHPDRLFREWRYTANRQWLEREIIATGINFEIR